MKDKNFSICIKAKITEDGSLIFPVKIHMDPGVTQIAYVRSVAELMDQAFISPSDIDYLIDLLVSLRDGGEIDESITSKELDRREELGKIIDRIYPNVKASEDQTLSEGKDESSGNFGADNTNQD